MQFMLVTWIDLSARGGHQRHQEEAQQSPEDLQGNHRQLENGAGRWGGMRIGKSSELWEKIVMTYEEKCLQISALEIQTLARCTCRKRGRTQKRRGVHDLLGEDMKEKVIDQRVGKLGNGTVWLSCSIKASRIIIIKLNNSDCVFSILCEILALQYLDRETKNLS